MRGTLFGTLFRDAFPGRSLVFCRGKPPIFSEKYRKSDFFRKFRGQNRVYAGFHGKRSEKVAIFPRKNDFFPRKKKYYRFFGKVPKASKRRSLRGKHAKSVFDALCVGRSPRRSFRKLTLTGTENAGSRSQPTCLLAFFR